jgi:hypothetical protein
MAKRAAKRAGEGIPPIYLRYYYYNDPNEPLPPRGSLTQGRTLQDAFNELAKEGKAILHRLFRQGASEQLRGKTARHLVVAKKWAGFLEEQDGATVGRPKDYGATLDRTRRTWMKYTVRIGTEEEAAHEHERNGYRPTVERLLVNTAKWYATNCEREGMEHNPTPANLQRFRSEQFLLPDLSEQELVEHYQAHPLPAWYAMGVATDAVEVTGPDAPVTPPLEYIRPTWKDMRERIPRDQLFDGWLKEYTAEVEFAADPFANDPELPDTFRWLVEELRKFRPATYEANGLRQELEGMADGAAFLSAMDRERERLVRKLEDIAPLTSTDGTTATQGTTKQPVAPIQWKGSVQQLAWLLRELAEKGWVGYPAQKGNTTKWKAGDINASAFARTMAPHFRDVNQTTLVQQLKPEGGTVPAADVEGWQIPKRPE